MEEIAGIFNSIGLVLTAILGGFGVISLSVAALLYMNAHGDPQQVNKAKTAAIGAIIGLIMGGMAWVLPGIISRAIVEPSGGQALTASGSVQGCDSIFKSQLVAQRQINSAARVNELVSTIQNTRDECRPDTWNPNAVSGLTASVAGCFDHDGKDVKTIANVDIPIGLESTASTTAGSAPKDTGRDGDNNIFIHFTDKRPPGDGFRCWMYVDRSGVWVGAGSHTAS